MENYNTPVVYTTNDNYSMQTAVSIASLLENNRHLHFCFYVLTEHVSEENIKRITHLVESYGERIKFIEMPELNDYAGFKLSLQFHGLPKVAYCRLFFSDLLPDCIEHLIYLDPDTLITGDIDDLVRTLNSNEFEEFYCAACLDGKSFYKRVHRFRKEENYYNAGVLLINLKRWRKDGIQEAFVQEIKRRRGKSADADQSYFNCVLINQIMKLPVKYNILTPYFNDYESFLKKSKYETKETYSETEIKEAINHPIIIHFTSASNCRPWYKDCKHPLADLWYKYLKRTEWKNYQPIENPNNNGKISIQKTILEIRFIRSIYYILYIRIRKGFKVKLYRKGNVADQ